MQRFSTKTFSAPIAARYIGAGLVWLISVPREQQHPMTLTNEEIGGHIVFELNDDSGTKDYMTQASCSISLFYKRRCASLHPVRKTIEKVVDFQG